MKKAVPIEKVLDRYGLLPSFTRRGQNLQGPCPLHRGYDPKQFKVSLEKNVFNCFGRCRGGGNVLDFVAKMEGVNVREAALLLMKWLGSTRATRRRAAGRNRSE